MARRCGDIIDKFKTPMKECVRSTRKTGRECGFCVKGGKVATRCQGGECGMMFPLRALDNSTVCFHTHPGSYMIGRPQLSKVDSVTGCHNKVKNMCVGDAKGNIGCYERHVGRHGRYSVYAGKPFCEYWRCADKRI